MKLTYLLVNFCTILVPLIFSFHPRIRFNESFKHFFIANAIVAVLFLCWDAYFTAIGVWGFNKDYVTGISFIGLPLEEVLFFICIPFACLFTYHSLTKFYQVKWNAAFEKVFVLVFSSVLLIVGIANIDRLYTSYTFISTSLVVLALKFLLRVDWLAKAFTIYAVLLIPFFIVNGILTGTGLDEPVVTYNNNENLGIRLLTIPVEDAFYGFELVVLNIYFFFLLQKRSIALKLSY